MSEAQFTNYPAPWGASPAVTCVKSPYGNGDQFCYPTGSSYWGKCMASSTDDHGNKYFPLVDVRHGVVGCSDGDLWNFPTPGSLPSGDQVQFAVFPKRAADPTTERSVPMRPVAYVDGAFKDLTPLGLPNPDGLFADRRSYNVPASACLTYQLLGNSENAGDAKIVDFRKNLGLNQYQLPDNCAYDGKRLVSIQPISSRVRGFNAQTAGAPVYVLAQPQQGTALLAYPNLPQLFNPNLSFSQ